MIATYLDMMRPPTVEPEQPQTDEELEAELARLWPMEARG